MGILLVIVLGGLVGYIASRLLGRDEGVLASVVIGIVGSFIGGFAARLLTGSDQSLLAFSWSGLIWATIGALILVSILNTVRKPGRRII